MWCWVSQVRLSSCSTRGFGWHPAAAAWATPGARRVVAIAVNTVIIKPQLQRYGTLVVMGWYYIIGLLITAPFFWKYIADTDFLRLPLSGQAELAYVLVLGTVLPMYLLYRGTEKLTFIHTALYRYIQPVVATVLALVRHQEQIDRTNIIAGGVDFRQYYPGDPRS